MHSSDHHSDSGFNCSNSDIARQRASENARRRARGNSALLLKEIQRLRESGQWRKCGKREKAMDGLSLLSEEEGGDAWSQRPAWTRKHSRRIPRQSMDYGSNSDDVDAESDEDQLQRQFLCELKSLHEQVAEKDTENELLREKIVTLTDNLVQTTEELAHRMALFSDVMTRSERLDAQIANAKKTLLTKEMQLHDLTQEKQALTTQLVGKEKEREHWEHEFVRVEEQLSDSTRRIQTLLESLNEHKQEVNAWKSKMKRALRTVDALKRQLDSQNEKEAELTQNLIQVKRKEMERERSWHTRNAKLERQLHTLERELDELRSVTNQAEVDKQQAQEDEVVWKSDVAAQQLEKQKQIVHLREKMSKLTSALEKVQVNEKLMHREICRLREELLLSESQRETEQRRFDQLVRGKDKEVAFIWQKYLDVMNPNIHASNKSTPS